VAWSIGLWDFGDVLTVHKAQGSEADDVLVLEERLPGNHNHARWLYTAVTKVPGRPGGGEAARMLTDRPRKM
jgi:hypothetical protein